MKHALLIVIVTVALTPSHLSAHRLDEYLQATRVGIERERVSLEIDLTPGVSVARQVTAWIDSDGNRVISLPESLAYGRRVLDALSLTVDGRAVSLALGTSRHRAWPISRPAPARCGFVRPRWFHPCGRAGTNSR